MTRRLGLAILTTLALACTGAPPAPTAAPTQPPAPTFDVQATVQAAVAATVAAAPKPAAQPAVASPIAARTAAPTVAPATAAPKPSGGLSAESVLEHFKAAGLPIKDEIVYTAETDANKLLGRPGQYIGKASWRDARVGTLGEPGTDTGGTVEIFASEAERQARETYVGAFAKSGPFVQYIYPKGRVLVRLTKDLTPAHAAEYETALKSLAG